MSTIKNKINKNKIKNIVNIFLLISINKILKIMFTWARTCSARYIYSNPRIAVEIVDASVAVVSSSKISAINACSSIRVATVSMSVAFTALTVWEIPEAGFTLAAGSTVSIWTALTSASFYVAEIVKCTNTIAVTGNASFWTKSIRSWRATIATSANYVWLTWTHSTIIFAQKTERARRIAITC